MDYTAKQQQEALIWWKDVPGLEKPLLIELHFSVWDIPNGCEWFLSPQQICEIYENEVINKVNPEVVITAGYLKADLGEIEQYKSVVKMSCYDWKSRLN